MSGSAEFQGNRNEQERPVRIYFQVTAIPDGEAPDEIRSQWLGLILPLRYDRSVEAPQQFETEGVLTRKPVTVDDGVEILGEDFIKTLRKNGKNKAADWWQNNWVDPENNSLVFAMQFGRFMSKEAKERFFPE